MSLEKTLTRDIKIIDFSEDTKVAIKTLNVEWLEKYFRVEPGDVKSLSDPVGEIIDKGGRIYYATYNGTIVGTASLIRITDERYELAKMAVTESAQGLGIGQLLMDHCMSVAEKLNLKSLVLYSNTKLGSAIHLYRKYGFVEVPLDIVHYERANIKMEKLL
jgi:ribosomal protein S18 acetylase RimI-like enzyme